jgi:hypothetical protein
MSKLDALRAMREAKYARDSASGPTRREAAAAAAGGAVPVAPAAPAAPTGAGKTAAKKRTPSASAKTEPVAAAPDGETCGHRSMNGRACTREAGHSEKSHRYS